MQYENIGESLTALRQLRDTPRSRPLESAMTFRPVFPSPENLSKAPETSIHPNDDRRHAAEREVDRFRQALGPFVAATEATRMAMVFTNALESGNPVIFANDSFLRLTGYSSAEIVDQSLDILASHPAESGSRVRIAEPIA